MVAALADSSKTNSSLRHERAIDMMPPRPSSRAATPSSQGSSTGSGRRTPRRPLMPRPAKRYQSPMSMRGALGLPRCPGAVDQTPTFGGGLQSQELPATPRLGSEASQELPNLSIMDAAIAASGEVSLYAIDAVMQAPIETAFEQANVDISDLLAWLQPMNRGNYLKGLSSLALEIDKKSQEWHAYLGGRCSRKESLEAIIGEEVPPKDFTRAAEACSLLIRMVRCLPVGFALRSMLEPVVQEVLDAIFCDWPSLLPSLQDLKDSEVTMERLGALTTYAQLVEGYKASAEKAKRAQEVAEQQAKSESAIATVKRREYEAIRVDFHKLQGEVRQLEDSKKKAIERAAEAEETFENFKEQTRLALSDFSNMQYRTQTMKADLTYLTRENKEKDLMIQQVREQSTQLTHKKQDIEEELFRVKRVLEVQSKEVDQVVKLKEKLEVFELHEAEEGLAFAKRMALEVFNQTLEEFCGLSLRLGSATVKDKRTTQFVLDSTLGRLRGVNVELDQVKKQVSMLHRELNDMKQLVPVWNEAALQDILDAYSEDAAVHRQVFSMKDHRNFAALGDHPSVPAFLRAEGLVRHIYVSKAECEDFLNAFYAEVGAAELNTDSLHSELHAHLQRKFSESEALTEFAYAFVCSLEAYRDDPDFELFDLMLGGAVHPGIMRDQEDMLQELQGLVRACHERDIDNPASKAGEQNMQTNRTRKTIKDAHGGPSARDQVTRRVMRAVLQSMFPEKSVERLNALMRALHVTLQMLCDAGKSPNPDTAYVSDLFVTTADGTQSPLIEELRRQQVHEVLEFTAEIARRMRKTAGGPAYVDRGHADNFLLIDQQGVRSVLSELNPGALDSKMKQMMALAWKENEGERVQVSEVLQRLRQNMLLKREATWVRASTKTVVEELLKNGPKHENAEGQKKQPAAQVKKNGTHDKREKGERASRVQFTEGEDQTMEEEEESKEAADETVVQPRRNRAVKVLDNPNYKKQLYNTPQGIEKEIQRSTPRILFADEEDSRDDAEPG
eukprot:TRINITY_DN29065_c0_g1_i1.p1 TRINITY_DN29065_c0_g1~~TRINITY_DN29065_c0_g1_i1.p1  ORF type:complete len:1015 (+),score=239.26 TRINITY_DN29065_c0_g1_i1:67-3111(+)